MQDVPEVTPPTSLYLLMTLVSSASERERVFSLLGLYFFYILFYDME